MHTKRFGLLGCVLALTCLNGCATTDLLQWGRDEVSIEYSTLRVKNVPTITDGLYAVVVPANWHREPVVEADDGILELSPLAALSLSPGWQSANPGATRFREMEKSDARRAFPHNGGGETEMGAYIDRLAGRNFRFHLLFGDAARHRWVRIGTIDIGPGTQSAMRRPISYVALPGAVAVDVVALPVMVIGGLFIVMAEGLGNLVSQ